MCLHNRTELESPIPSVEGFKIFYRKNVNLYSPFVNSHINENASISLFPAFETNKVISVQPEDKTFFSFKEFKNACSVANKDFLYVIGKTLIVRPVTAIDVVATGSFFVPSDDPQCLDGYYPSYESKKLIVHDTPEVERQINEMLVQSFIERNKWNLSYMQESAFKYFLAK